MVFERENRWLSEDLRSPVGFPIKVYFYEMPKKFTFDLLWLFHNTYRETSNATSNGSPVNRLIEQGGIIRAKIGAELSGIKDVIISEGTAGEGGKLAALKRESEDGVLSSEIGIHLEDSPVMFSIKSLRIPELVIEVPETATVGLLKRTVKEAVTALLSGRIRIGVLV